MEKVGQIEVVDVGDNAESGVIGQREEESLMDENTKIFYTILVEETIEDTRGKLEFLKDQGSDTYGAFKYFFHFFFINQTPIASSLLSGVQAILLPSKDSLWIGWN